MSNMHEGVICPAYTPQCKALHRAYYDIYRLPQDRNFLKKLFENSCLKDIWHKWSVL